MKYFYLILSALLLVTCGEDQAAKTMTITTERGPFEIKVEADGELRAVNTTPLNAPRSRGGPNIIAWLAEEGSYVKEGDVLVRFDQAGLKVKERESTTELTSLDYRNQIDGRNHGQETNNLDGQIFVLGEEREKAERFAITDETLFNRNEIIESEVDIKLLDTKVDHFSQKKDRHVQTGNTQQEINGLNIKSEQIKLDQVRERMKNLQMTAPHDGYFFYHRNWRGEPVKIGEMAWGKVGELPDLSSMEAVVQVLEKEANGLKDGLSAQIILDARPGFAYKATIKSVATLAKPLDRESPVNYFEVVLTLETTEPQLMRPGGHVRAAIFLDQQDEVIALPNQVFFKDEGKTYVYVKKGGAFERREVEIGKRGPTRTIVEKGLKEGEKVAMNDPTRGAK